MSERRSRGKIEAGGRMGRLALCYINVANIDITCPKCLGHKKFTNMRGYKTDCKKCQGTGRWCNATSLLKPIAELLTTFGGNENKVAKAIREVGEYFESLGFDWTLYTVLRDWPLIGKWKENNELRKGELLKKRWNL